MMVISPLLQQCLTLFLSQTVCLLVHKTLLMKVSSMPVLDLLRAEQISADVTEAQLTKEYTSKARWDHTRHRVYEETKSKLGLP